MLRRVYFLFPERRQVEKAVTELVGIGIERWRMHTIAREDVDISGLPEATVRQRTDFGAKLEEFGWHLNLAAFFFALLLFLVSLFVGAWYWSLGCLLVMAGTFFAGNYFASYVPHMHLNAFEPALRHGEILLMVDVPRWRVSDVYAEVRKHHPEAEGDGVGWALDGLRI